MNHQLTTVFPMPPHTVAKEIGTTCKFVALQYACHLKQHFLMAPGAANLVLNQRKSLTIYIYFHSNLRIWKSRVHFPSFLEGCISPINWEGRQLVIWKSGRSIFGYWMKRGKQKKKFGILGSDGRFLSIFSTSIPILGTCRGLIRPLVFIKL